MILCFFHLGIFSPKISVNYGVLLDFLYVQLASLDVAVSVLLHRHSLDTLEVPRLISLQMFCPFFFENSCEFLTP